MTPAEQIVIDRMLGRLSYQDAHDALTRAGADATVALGYVHIAPSPLLGARGALRAAGHDVTRIDPRRAL